MDLQVRVRKQILTCRQRAIANSVNFVHAIFTFDDEWTGTNKYVVFTNGKIQKKLPLPEDNQVVVPWETLSTPGELYISVVGKENGEVRITTKYMDTPVVVDPSGDLGGDPPSKPTVDIWDQALLDIEGNKRNIEQLETDVALKLNKDQGIENTGKVLTVGPDGNITNENPSSFIKQSDYDQEDPLQPDFIKNRPFSVELRNSEQLVYTLLDGDYQGAFQCTINGEHYFPSEGDSISFSVKSADGKVLLSRENEKIGIVTFSQYESYIGYLLGTLDAPEVGIVFTADPDDGEVILLFSIKEGAATVEVSFAKEIISLQQKYSELFTKDMTDSNPSSIKFIKNNPFIPKEISSEAPPQSNSIFETDTLIASGKLLNGYEKGFFPTSKFFAEGEEYYMYYGNASNFISGTVYTLKCEKSDDPEGYSTGFILKPVSEPIPDIRAITQMTSFYHQKIENSSVMIDTFSPLSKVRYFKLILKSGKTINGLPIRYSDLALLYDYEFHEWRDQANESNLAFPPRTCDVIDFIEHKFMTLQQQIDELKKAIVNNV